MDVSANEKEEQRILKQIQEWLGHSDFGTTTNIYAHMDPRAKISSAEAMVRGLGLEDSDEKD